MTDLTPEEVMEMEWVRYWRERAERAEAEELLARNAVADAMQHIGELYAALGRVRALCDETDRQNSDRLVKHGVSVTQVRAAIEGDQQ